MALTPRRERESDDLIGDGWRTRRAGFPERLAAAGFGEWNDLAKLDEVRDLLADVLGAGRVLVGCEGFNAVGGDPAINLPS